MESGLRFTQACAPSATCTPSRYAALTGEIEPGTSDAMLSLLDLFPTLAALAGKPYPENAGKDGESLLPALLGQPGAQGRDSIVLHGIGDVLALRAGGWKFIPANADTATGIGRGADPRDTRFAEARVSENLLFNLAQDPLETKNLAIARPKKTAEMAARLAQVQH